MGCFDSGTKLGFEKKRTTKYAKAWTAQAGGTNGQRPRKRDQGNRYRKERVQSMSFDSCPRDFQSGGRRGTVPSRVIGMIQTYLLCRERNQPNY